MDELRTPWPEPTGDPNSHAEGGSRLLGSLLLLIFHPPMKIQNSKKDNQASFHESITILKRSLKVVVDLDKKILLTRRPVCRAQSENKHQQT